MRLVVASTGARLGARGVGGRPYLFVLQGRAACPARRVRALETGENTHWSAVVKVIAPSSDRYGSSVPDGGIRDVLAYRADLERTLHTPEVAPPLRFANRRKNHATAR
jgi:hypothetical protein